MSGGHIWVTSESAERERLFILHIGIILQRSRLVATERQLHGGVLLSGGLDEWVWDDGDDEQQHVLSGILLSSGVEDSAVVSTGNVQPVARETSGDGVFGLHGRGLLWHVQFVGTIGALSRWILLLGRV